MLLTPALLTLLLAAAGPARSHPALAGETCAEGSIVTGAEPPDGTERGCQKRTKSGEYVRHGHWMEWYLNGQKQKEGHYVDGLRQGSWTWWYPNGKKMQEGKFWDDKPVGIWAFWDENGKNIRTKEQIFVKPSGEEVVRPRPVLDDFTRNLKKGFKEN